MYREINNLRKEVIEKRIQISDLEKEISKYNKQISTIAQRKIYKRLEHSKLLPEIPRKPSLITNSSVSKKDLSINNRKTRRTSSSRSKKNRKKSSETSKVEELVPDEKSTKELKEDVEFNIIVDPKTNKIVICDVDTDSLTKKEQEQLLSSNI